MFKEIIEINNKAQQIIHSEIEWEEKYSLIFSENISRKVFNTINLDYYDPDTSYQEDVFAFTSALDEWVSKNI